MSQDNHISTEVKYIFPITKEDNVYKTAHGLVSISSSTNSYCITYDNQARKKMFCVFLLMGVIDE